MYPNYLFFIAFFGVMIVEKYSIQKVLKKNLKKILFK